MMPLYRPLSCENFEKFGPVTSELTGLIFVNVMYDTAAFSQISPDRFLQSYESEQMMDLYLIFQFFKGRCHGNQIIFAKMLSTPTDIPLAFVAIVL